MLVVGSGRAGWYHAISADIGAVCGQQRAEIRAVTDHANDRRNVIIQGYEHRLVTIGPRRGEVFQRDVIETHIVHRHVCGAGRIVGVDHRFHQVQFGGRRRNAGETLVNSLSLFTWSGVGRRDHPNGNQGNKELHPCLVIHSQPTHVMIHDVCCINGFKLSIDPSMQKSLPDCDLNLRDYTHSPRICA